jgi:hypothetical protein
MNINSGKVWTSKEMVVVCLMVLPRHWADTLRGTLKMYSQGNQQLGRDFTGIR